MLEDKDEEIIELMQEVNKFEEEKSCIESHADTKMNSLLNSIKAPGETKKPNLATKSEPITKQIEPVATH